MAENPTNPGQLPTNPSSPSPQQVPAQPPFKQVMLSQKGPQPIRPGSLFVCKYIYWKHDPTPLVLVSALYKDGRIAGINLHNLQLKDMRNLVAQYCNKMFTYQGAIKGRKELEKGFRTYRSDGLKQVKVLDCEYFLNSLNVIKQARMMSPNEVEKIRLQIQQQLRQRINPKVNNLVKNSQASGTIPTIPGKPASIPGIPTGQ